MPAHRLTPDNATLRRLLEKGLTAPEIAEWTLENLGNKVDPRTIYTAISRAGLSESRVKYGRTIPWRVKMVHAHKQPVVMLRALGKRLNDEEIEPHIEVQLNNWLGKLKTEGTVVGYDPASDVGFFYIGKEYKDHKDTRVPVRKAELKGMDRSRSA